MWYVEEEVEENIFHQPGLKVGAFLKILERQLKAHKGREGLFETPHPVIEELRKFVRNTRESYQEEDRVPGELRLALVSLLLHFEEAVKQGSAVHKTLAALSAGFDPDIFTVLRQLRRVGIFPKNTLRGRYDDHFHMVGSDYAGAVKETVEAVIKHLPDHPAVQRYYIENLLYGRDSDSRFWNFVAKLVPRLAEVELLPVEKKKIRALFDSIPSEKLPYGEARPHFAQRSIKTIQGFLEEAGCWTQAKAQLQESWHLFDKWGLDSQPTKKLTLVCLADSLKYILGDSAMMTKEEDVLSLWNTILCQQSSFCAICQNRTRLSDGLLEKMSEDARQLFLSCIVQFPDVVQGKQGLFTLCFALDASGKNTEPLERVPDLLSLQRQFPQIDKTITLLVQKVSFANLEGEGMINVLFKFISHILESRKILMRLEELNQCLDGYTGRLTNVAEFIEFTHKTLAKQTEPDSLLIQSAAAYKFWHRPSCADVEALKDRNPPVPLVLRKMLR